MSNEQIVIDQLLRVLVLWLHNGATSSNFTSPLSCQPDFVSDEATRVVPTSITTALVLPYRQLQIQENLKLQ